MTTTPIDTITIRTDRGALPVPSGCTLAQAVDRILAGQDRAPDAVATAVNGEFVARGQRHAHVLKDGDTVLCFSPITGG